MTSLKHHQLHCHTIITASITRERVSGSEEAGGGAVGLGGGARALEEAGWYPGEELALEEEPEERAGGAAGLGGAGLGGGAAGGTIATLAISSSTSLPPLAAAVFVVKAEKEPPLEHYQLHC